MNIYNIPAQYRFSKTLVDKIFEINDNDLLKISEYVILLPSKRACRNLREAFLAKNNYKPMLFPLMYPLGEIDEEELDFDSFLNESFFEIEPAISVLEQRILLALLIRKYNSDKDISESLNLSIDLQQFLNELQKEKIDLTNLDKVFPEDLASHWQKIMSFLEILWLEWPNVIGERKQLDPIDRRNKIIEERANIWAKHKPSYPIIAAGSTGSLPSTLYLLKVIANLEQGIVILPGLDPYIDDVSWQNINEFHPQFILKHLLDEFKLDRKLIKNWLPNNAVEEATTQRSIFLSEIMRPAITSHNWQRFRQLEIGTLKNLSWINCDNIQQEANLISVILREALEEPDKTIALVTPDLELAKRVELLVKKWDIEIDYSSGEKLTDTILGVYLRLIIDLIKSNFSPVPLLALLKHKLTNVGFDREILKELINKLEVKVFRGITSIYGISEIKKFLKIYNEDMLIEFLDKIEQISSKLQGIFEQKTVEFSEMLDAHLLFAEELHSDNPADLWNSEIGLKFSDFFVDLRILTKPIGKINPNHYNQIFENLLIHQTYRKEYSSTRVAILSPIEARMHNYDIIILGGLNEGIWPAYPETGPWVSRAMRKKIGLSLPEKKIGQSAHDFYSLAHTNEVIFTRSAKIGGTVTVASRWLQRLETVLQSVGMKESSFNVKPWVKWIELNNTPASIIPIERPSPKPDIAFRPTNFSVTQIENLIRNPYKIYATDILKLKTIDDIDMDPKAADFGNFVHKALEIYINYTNINNESDYDILIKSGMKALMDLYYKPNIYNIWWPKFERIAMWLVKNKKLVSKHHIYSEIKGKFEFEIDGKIFCLTTKADRIEIDNDNNVNIIDYKTGSLPDNKNIINGISSQMILEAVIAKYGGYFCQAKNIKYNIGDLTYIRLTGGDVIGETKKLKFDLDQLITEAIEGITNLFREFNKNETSYLYCPDPGLKPRYNEYEHLARVLEWIE